MPIPALIKKMKRTQFVTQSQENDTPRVLIVGGERNEHGTRICRKITCGKCQKVDYVAVSRTKKGDTFYCRDCAKTEISAYEKGTRVKCEMVDVNCGQCAKVFTYPKAFKRNGSLLCSDCYSGFEVWRGSLEQAVHERDMSNLARRPAGTLLRSNRSL